MGDSRLYELACLRDRIDSLETELEAKDDRIDDLEADRERLEKYGLKREAMIGNRELAFELTLGRYQQLDWGVPDEVFVYDCHSPGDGKKHQQVTDLARHVREPILSPY